MNIDKPCWWFKGWFRLISSYIQLTNLRNYPPSVYCVENNTCCNVFKMADMFAVIRQLYTIFFDNIFNNISMHEMSDFHIFFLQPLS